MKREVTETSKPKGILLVLGVLAYLGLFFVVMPAAIWVFLLIAYYLWSTVLSWLWCRLPTDVTCAVSWLGLM